MELHRKHKDRRERSYGGGGGLSYALTGDGEFIAKSDRCMRGAAKNTIRGKVVASPESGPW
jgi:hypothetical protein